MGGDCGCWDKVLHSNRHEAQDLHHTKAEDLLAVDWNLICLISATDAGCRTVAVGARVSPAWRHEKCSWCQNNLVVTGIILRAFVKAALPSH